MISERDLEKLGFYFGHFNTPSGFVASVLFMGTKPTYHIKHREFMTLEEVIEYLQNEKASISAMVDAILNSREKINKLC